MDTPKEKARALECMDGLLIYTKAILENIAVLFGLFEDSPEMQPSGTEDALKNIDEMRSDILALRKKFVEQE